MIKYWPIWHKSKDPNSTLTENDRVAASTNSDALTDDFAIPHASYDDQPSAFYITDDIYLETAIISHGINVLPDPSPQDTAPQDTAPQNTISPPDDSVSDPYDPQYCAHPELKLLSELSRLEQEQHYLLKPISDQSPAVGQYLKGLNRRLALLQQFVLAAAPGAHAQPNCTVTLSEAGIGVINMKNNLKNNMLQDNLPLGSTWHVQMILFPSLAHICAFATVNPQKVTQDPAHYTLQFLGLAHSDRQLIARHIIQKQAHELRLHQNNLTQNTSSQNNTPQNNCPPSS